MAVQETLRQYESLDKEERKSFFEQKDSYTHSLSSPETIEQQIDANKKLDKIQDFLKKNYELYVDIVEDVEYELIINACEEYDQLDLLQKATKENEESFYINKSKLLKLAKKNKKFHKTLEDILMPPVDYHIEKDELLTCAFSSPKHQIAFRFIDYDVN